MPAKKKKADIEEWEWKDDSGEWNTFHDEDAALLEEHYNEDKSKVFATTDFSFNKANKTVYTINLGKMTQTNNETKVTRALRRGGVEVAKKKKIEAWSWQDDDDEWKPFAEEDARMMETEYQDRGPKAKFTTTDFSFNKKHKTNYAIDFAKMTQTNKKTGVSRAIQRGKVVEGTEKKEGTKSKGGPNSKLWEWWSAEEKKWKKYADKDAALLESAFNSETKTFLTKDLTFNKGFDSQYVFDFIVMAQINSDSGTSRKIRRGGAKAGKKKAAKKEEDEAETDEEDDGYGAALSDITSGDKSTKSDGKKKALAPEFKASLDAKIIAKQRAFGAQSLRGGQSLDYGPAVSADPHGRKCFDQMLKNEKEFCGEWVVFYHSYSAAALLYEVQAAVACVLFRFKSAFATLPRLLYKPFEHIDTAARMLEEFPKWPDRDHNSAFRGVGLCGTSSLLAHDSEAPAKSVFLMGYSVGPTTGLVEGLLKACGVPPGKVAELTKGVVKAAEESGLDCCSSGGKPCKSGRAGHFLQIFIRRELVDKYVYPSFPYGVPDKKRDKPLSKYLETNVKIDGQIRITANPDIFLRATCVRMFVFSADPTFHAKRAAFQTKLVSLLEPILGDKSVRTKAATGIFAGKLPAWWSSEDQSEKAEMSVSRYSTANLDDD